MTIPVDDFPLSPSFVHPPDHPTPEISNRRHAPDSMLLDILLANRDDILQKNWVLKEKYNALRKEHEALQKEHNNLRRQFFCELGAKLKKYQQARGNTRFKKYLGSFCDIFVFPNSLITNSSAENLDSNSSQKFRLFKDIIDKVCRIASIAK